MNAHTTFIDALNALIAQAKEIGNEAANDSFVVIEHKDDPNQPKRAGFIHRTTYGIYDDNDMDWTIGAIYRWQNDLGTSYTIVVAV